MIRNYRNIASTNSSYLSALASGQSQVNIYNPEIYNDREIYSYFYIDFQRDVNSFSFGMLRESINVLGNSSLKTINGFQKISSRLFRIVCDISKEEEITVINKRNSWLTFLTGNRIPSFSSSFFVDGADIIFRPAYVYDISNITDFGIGVSDLKSELHFYNEIKIPILDSINITYFGIDSSENISIIFF